MANAWAGIGCFLAIGCAIASPAAAYTYESIAAEGCHERLTFAALREARTRVPEHLRIISPTTRDDRALLDDLTFSLPGDLDDLASAALVIANRDNDLKGRAPTDITSLAEVHGDDEAQREHCLRSRDQDGEAGAAAAVAACRSFILEQVDFALEHGLDGNGAISGERLAEIRVSLDFAGQQTVMLPAFYVGLGRALHALQDSFAHTFRNPEGHREVREVLNWVDEVEGSLKESRDGPAHIAELDTCDRDEALFEERRALALEASTALLVDAANAALPVQARRQRVMQTLDTYLTYEPGCNAGNRWCDAPEYAFRDAGCGCGVLGANARSKMGGGVCALLLAVALLVRARRRSMLHAVPALLILGGSLFPAVAQADDAWGAAVQVGAAASRTAGAVSAGGRYRFADEWLLGVDAEWNPWASFDTFRVRPGVINAYATLIKRWPLTPRIALRSTLHLGTSTILFDLVGVPAGSTGVFLGGELVGVEFDLGSGSSFVLSPALVVVPIPQLDGVPFAYPQYRLALAWQFGAVRPAPPPQVHAPSRKVRVREATNPR